MELDVIRCPYCSSIDNKVVDSRIGKEGDTILRRRECLTCEGRFTTYERVEEVLPSVIKKDGRREPYDRAKILSGLKSRVRRLIPMFSPDGRWLVFASNRGGKVRGETNLFLAQWKP